jgi:hypothetical protein
MSEFDGRWQELHFPFLNRAAVRLPVVVVVVVIVVVVVEK